MSVIRTECITPPWLLEGRAAQSNPLRHRPNRPEVKGTDGYESTIGPPKPGAIRDYLDQQQAAARYKLAKDALCQVQARADQPR